jgi:DNA polymerase-3 subunit gamma/tau
VSYLVLARKYRPETFDEVVGQAHVTKTLSNAIESGRVGHAYLFSGPRGVGKTTTARLFAKSLNCPNAKGAVPCNKCDVCREIVAGVSLDVIEIDAASNRGIDEIRNLRENVKYAPAGGKFKVYVVDEVHMLTEAAFNALLKTLEEPPTHVKFVLATTAPLKVPETILSRCQRFEFVRIPTSDVFERLKHIREKENFRVSDEVLMLLSRRANGSLRDAESMLDQLVSAGLEVADDTEVAKLMGLSGAEVFFDVVDAVKARDARKALEVLGNTFNEGVNLDEFTDGLMEHLRNLLLMKIHPDLSSLVEASAGHIKRYEEQVKKFTETDLMRLVNVASRASYVVRKSVLPRLHLEMAVVEMAHLDSTVELGELIERLKNMEANLPDTGPAAPEPEPEASRPPQGNASAEKSPPAETARPEVIAREAADKREDSLLARVKDEWKGILVRLNKKKKTLGVCLSVCKIRGIKGGKLVLAFPEDKPFEFTFAEDKANKKVIQEELSSVLGTNLGVTCVVSNDPVEEASGEVSIFENDESSSTSKNDNSIKTVIEFFDGEIIEE